MLMQSGSLLHGNNTIPGCEVSPEVRAKIPEILQACRDFGLDFYDTVVEFLTYDEISEIASYGGFPVRYPHWRWGMEYEEMSRGYEHGYFKISEMVVNCLHPDTLISTHRGLLPANKVVVGDTVVSLEGTREVVAVVEQPPSDVYEIVLDGFLPKTICTPTHKWYCLRNEVVGWMETRHLKPGDQILAGGRYEDFLDRKVKHGWTKYVNEGLTALDIFPEKTITLEIAESLGIVVGSCCYYELYTEKQYFCRIFLTLEKSQKDYLDYVIKLFETAFDIKTSIRERDNVYNVRTQSWYLGTFIDHLDIPTEMIVSNRKVPKLIWACSNEFRAAFLRGLFDMEGEYQDDHLILNCRNKKFAEEIQQLLLNLGIKSFYKKKQEEPILIIEDLKRFQKYIGSSRKVEFKKADDCVTMYVVKDVKKLLQPASTIDIALKEDHDFLANGLCTHNTNPCYIYCLNSNSFVDHVTVIAHATGHNDFFKNNIYFSPTSQNMMNELANHGSRIRRYMSEWGNLTVQRFIDKILSIQTLLDGAKAWQKKQYAISPSIKRKKQEDPRRLTITHDYMDDWINTKEWIDEEKERIRKNELAELVGVFGKPEKDIFGFIKDNAPLNHWQQAIASMLYEESMYFYPQRNTKVCNEAHASWVDSHIMAKFGMAEDDIVEYSLHKAYVLGGKYSNNPYKLGYNLYSWIEDKWNKGRFGKEYEECKDAKERENWDTKAGLGIEKVFEIRKFYDDINLISEFFDQEFCDEYEFFFWKEFPDGHREIVNRDAKDIKRTLINSKLNGGLPDIRLVEPNFRGKRIMAIQHYWDGRILHPRNTIETIQAISYLWNGPVMILTKDKEGDEFCWYIEESQGPVMKTQVSKI